MGGRRRSGRDGGLFVAILHYSQKTIVAACPSVGTDAWCQASVDAFAFYDGIPRLFTIYNLKTGVTRHTSEG